MVYRNCDLTNERVRLLLFVKSCSSLNQILGHIVTKCLVFYQILKRSVILLVIKPCGIMNGRGKKQGKNAIVHEVI